MLSKLTIATLALAASIATAQKYDGYSSKPSTSYNTQPKYTTNKLLKVYDGTTSPSSDSSAPSHEQGSYETGSHHSGYVPVVYASDSKDSYFNEYDKELSYAGGAHYEEEPDYDRPEYDEYGARTYSAASHSSTTFSYSHHDGNTNEHTGHHDGDTSYPTLPHEGNTNDYSVGHDGNTNERSSHDYQQQQQYDESSKEQPQYKDYPPVYQPKHQNYPRAAPVYEVKKEKPTYVKRTEQNAPKPKVNYYGGENSYFDEVDADLSYSANEYSHHDGNTNEYSHHDGNTNEYSHHDGNTNEYSHHDGNTNEYVPVEDSYNKPYVHSKQDYSSYPAQNDYVEDSYKSYVPTKRADTYKPKVTPKVNDYHPGRPDSYKPRVVPKKDSSYVPIKENKPYVPERVYDDYKQQKPATYTSTKVYDYRPSHVPSNNNYAPQPPAYEEEEYPPVKKQENIYKSAKENSYRPTKENSYSQKYRPTYAKQTTTTSYGRPTAVPINYGRVPY